MLINEQSMLLYTALNENSIVYHKNDLSESQSNPKYNLLNDLSYLKNKPKFSEIKVAFIHFSYISPQSSIWGTFLDNVQALKDNYTNTLFLYSYERYKTLQENLHVEDIFETIIFQKTCFGSIDVSGSNTEEEIKTSCATYKFPKNDDTYTANLSGYFEYIDEKNEYSDFSSLLLKSKFATQKELKGKPISFEDKKMQAFWFMAFLMSPQSSFGYEGYVLFKGTANQAGINLSTESVAQQFQAPLSIQTTPVLVLRDFQLEKLLQSQPEPEQQEPEQQEPEQQEPEQQEPEQQEPEQQEPEQQEPEQQEPEQQEPETQSLNLRKKRS